MQRRNKCGPEQGPHLLLLTKIFNTDFSIYLRNQVFHYEGIDLLVTYHPAALLRNPNFKKSAWEDFQLIRDKYLIQN